MVLFRSVPIGDGARAPAAEETIQFPGGQVPVALDIAFPQTFYVGGLPRYRVSDAVVHVRVRSSGGELFPTSESYKVEFGVLGFTFTGAQTIRYKSARRCAEAPPEAE